MSVYMFGLHTGHLTAKADRIAARHNVFHVNHTEPHGQRHGWFECDNRGSPFDQDKAEKVMAAIDRAGGIEALRHKQDRENAS